MCVTHLARLCLGHWRWFEVCCGFAVFFCAIKCYDVMALLPTWLLLLKLALGCLGSKGGCLGPLFISRLFLLEQFAIYEAIDWCHECSPS